MKDPKRELEKARSRFAQKEDKKKFFRKPTKKEVYRGFFSILVFLIILGSLFWFGYFLPYNAMQSSSRISDTNANYSHARKYIAAELAKCRLGLETTAMDGGITCSGNTTAKTVTAAVSKMKDKNPYASANNAIRSSTSNTSDADAGYVSLSSSGSTITVKSCNKKPCSTAANQALNTVEVE